MRVSLYGEERTVRVAYRLHGGGWLGRTVDVLEDGIRDTSEPFVIQDDTPFHGRELGKEWYAARNSANANVAGKEVDPLADF